jgi:hypothetical protein
MPAWPLKLTNGTNSNACAATSQGGGIGRTVVTDIQCQVCYQLKTPYRDGTSRVIFEPLSFIARLAALVPNPRVHLTRLHGVFAPNSKQLTQVMAMRGKGKRTKTPEAAQDPTPTERRTSLTWSQRLKRVFNIDIETCRERGGAEKVIACIEDPMVI